MFEVSGISVTKLEISPFFFLSFFFFNVTVFPLNSVIVFVISLSFHLVLTYPYETVSLYLHILILAQITEYKHMKSPCVVPDVDLACIRQPKLNVN